MLRRFCCPICSKSVIDMSRIWKRIDEEVDLFNLAILADTVFDLCLFMKIQWHVGCVSM